MIFRNATQLAARESVAAKGFYEVLWRWSRVGCEAPKRNYVANKPSTRGRGHAFCRARPPLAIPALSPRSRSHSSNYCSASNPILKDNPSPTPLVCEGTPLPYPKCEPPEPADSPTPIEDTPLSSSVRHLMRTLPSPVVVLTSTTPEHYRGMTISSFTTLTLSPNPIVTFNIRLPSRTLNAILASHHFLVHILEASPEGAAIADLFTKANWRGCAEGLSFVEGKERGIFEVQRLKGELGLPWLRGSGVKKVLRCEVMRTEANGSFIHIGDHVLMLGRVLNVLEGGVPRDDERVIEGDSTAEDDRKQGLENTRSDHYGLSYVNGRYRRVGEAIPLKDGIKE